MNTIYRSNCGCITSTPEPNYAARRACCDDYKRIARAYADPIIARLSYQVDDEKHATTHALAWEAEQREWEDGWVARLYAHADSCPICTWDTPELPRTNDGWRILDKRLADEWEDAR